MMGFLGEYEATVDSKGRFLLPIGLKKQMPEGFTTLVINRGMERCLNIYLPEVWQEEVEKKLKTVNPFDGPENRLIRKAMIAGANYVELDSAGRLNIPTVLAEYGNLTKDIVLAGDIEKIEIWDKTNYARLFESLTPEKLTEMARLTLGSESKKPD